MVRTRSMANKPSPNKRQSTPRSKKKKTPPTRRRASSQTARSNALIAGFRNANRNVVTPRRNSPSVSLPSIATTHSSFRNFELNATPGPPSGSPSPSRSSSASSSSKKARGVPESKKYQSILVDWNKNNSTTRYIMPKKGSVRHAKIKAQMMREMNKNVPRKLRNLSKKITSPSSPEWRQQQARARHDASSSRSSYSSTRSGNTPSLNVPSSKASSRSSKSSSKSSNSAMVHRRHGRGRGRSQRGRPQKRRVHPSGSVSTTSSQGGEPPDDWQQAMTPPSSRSPRANSNQLHKYPSPRANIRRKLDFSNVR